MVHERWPSHSFNTLTGRCSGIGLLSAVDGGMKKKGTELMPHAFEIKLIASSLHNESIICGKDFYLLPKNSVNGAYFKQIDQVHP